ncbi:MAG TPA: MFS transporter [Gaiellaceae bacterium]|nr:MFS transporter [Gaiellaceae bacterium]
MPRLPRAVYVFQAGLVLNAFGNGAANPFIVIYLHEVRGIPLGLAGLAGSTSALCGLGGALAAGSIADRLGARTAMRVGLVLSTTGFAFYPLVREPWHAIVLAAVAGCGTGTWLTAQSALVAGLVPPSLRHVAFAQQRVAANIGLGFGGFVGGVIVTVSDPSSFTRLFLLDAATFAAYGLVLALVPASGRRVTPGGGYAAAARDRPFLGVVALNFVWVVSTIALMNSLFPVFAHERSGVSTHAIGVLFLVNSLTIVVLQLPVSRAVEGRRRMRMLALMAAVFAGWWLLVLGTGLRLTGAEAVAVLAVAIGVLAVGECVYDAVHGPLVAELAPEGSTGRYLAVSGFGWQLGFIVSPAVGGLVLTAEPLALPVAAAAVCIAGGVLALALERALPAGVQITPRIEEQPVTP